MQWVIGLSTSLAAARNAAPFAAVFVTIAALLVIGVLAFVVLPWPDGLRRKRNRNILQDRPSHRLYDGR